MSRSKPDINSNDLIQYNLENENKGSSGRPTADVVISSQQERSTEPPEPSNMFTGRADILNQLSAYFSDTTTSAASTTQRVFVLLGMGGVGKTQIALKFVNEYQARYEPIDTKN